jgi:hypothetical protein
MLFVTISIIFYKVFIKLFASYSGLLQAEKDTANAHPASLAIEHSRCIFSTDNDFSRFKSLRWKNPLL